MGVVPVPHDLGVLLGLSRHLGFLPFTFRRIADQVLTEFFVLALDIVADQPKQIAFGQLSRTRCRCGIGTVGRLFLQGSEAGVPFEVSKRAAFLRLCKAGRFQRLLNERSANIFDELQRHATLIIKDALAAQQTLFTRHLIHPRLCISNV